MNLQPSPAPTRVCPACGSDHRRAKPQYSRDPWQVVGCTACGFTYLANPVDYASLVDDFAWEKTTKTERAYRRKSRPIVDGLSQATRWRLKLFRRNKAQVFLNVFGPGRVLDIGCGGGGALPPPIEPYGVEISKALAASADQHMRARGGYCVHAAAIDGAKTFADGFFQGVLVHSFLEHEVNPLPLLQECARVLAPGGKVFVRVPNFASVNRRVMGGKWCGFRHPDHVNYFTPTSLADMGAKAGFRLKIRNWPTLAFDDNIKGVLVKQAG